MRRSLGLLGALLSLSLAVAAASPAAAVPAVIADWQMNETEANRPTMTDTSGNGLHGTIGSHVYFEKADGATGGGAYRFKVFCDPATTPPTCNQTYTVDDERLVTLPDDDRLDPDGVPYRVTIRFKTSAKDPNIIQKGQANQVGGYWKLAFKTGCPRCHFRDGAGVTLATGLVNTVYPKVNDGTWNTIACERTAKGVKITVDYEDGTAPVVKILNKAIGPINNAQPLSIGGKSHCDGGEPNGGLVTCDYLAGLIDFVKIEKEPTTTTPS